MNLYDYCLEIAEKYHNGQTRKNGQPYISHPKAVVDILSPENAPASEALLCVGILHDVIEDSSLTLNELYAYLCSISTNYETIKNIVIGVWGVTKKARGLETYLDYLYRVSSNSLSSKVKFADLKHNLSDLDEGNLRDKYIITEAWLAKEGVRCHVQDWNLLFNVILKDKMK